MVQVVSIVEGDGEVQALPVLLRRLNFWLTPECSTTIHPPIRVHRDRFIRKAEEFTRILLLASKKCLDDGWILILLDADDDCPVQMANELLRRAREVIPHRSVSVVLANREFEAWFLAAARSLHGCRGFTWDVDRDALEGSETVRNAKGRMAERMGGAGYHETTDQPKFAHTFDLDMAVANSRSFRKLCADWTSGIQR
ncbi:DUF4276 family protein [Paraburkholderia phosphatilytica]|uniref:DUF4276 family protein n=1 Tax=Paraburkholderia phosphatilytica TaxID=2282883 RepID=UPI000E49ECAA|nr:DUF4276 family protein [Paraburkholderia phosphatilytica]